MSTAKSLNKIVEYNDVEVQSLRIGKDYYKVYRRPDVDV